VSEPLLPIAEAGSKDTVGKQCRIRGWVYRTRSSGGLAFVVVRDASGIIQVTARKQVLGDEAYAKFSSALIESSVEVTGEVAEDRRAPGGYELRATTALVHAPAEPFPIFSGQTDEFLLDKRHLSIRSSEIVATLKVKAEILHSARAYLDEHKYLEMTPPILTGNAAEGGSEAFTFEYFGREAYLSQTAQLYLEALIYPLERVYSITPSFRAEKSRTNRHLTEYTHLEVESAWTGLKENLELQEGLIAHICHEVATRRPRELEALGRKPEEMLAITAPFERIRYEEALERLKTLGHPLEFGQDLGTNEERALTAERKQPLFVTNYPAEIKAFYMLRNAGDSRLVDGNDMLAPEGYGEIIGASCRETDIEVLKARLEKQGAKMENYDWYLDLRRYGSVPHSGFGLGVERVVRWICKREHIRDTTPFPRTPSRVTP
jgi:asparaginyl-tRNA synthetase